MFDYYKKVNIGKTCTQCDIIVELKYPDSSVDLLHEVNYVMSMLKRLKLISRGR